MSDLPKVELIDGAFYWVRHAYEKPDLWAVARWEHSCWWDLNGREFTPRTIQGPIPRPEDTRPPQPPEPRERWPG